MKSKLTEDIDNADKALNKLREANKHTADGLSELGRQLAENVSIPKRLMDGEGVYIHIPLKNVAIVDIEDIVYLPESKEVKDNGQAYIGKAYTGRKIKGVIFEPEIVIN